MTVSEASRRDIAAWSGWPDRRIRVITEGPDPIFGPGPIDPEADAVLGRLGISARRAFLLYVGGLSPHKNLLRLVEAFARGGRSRRQARARSATSTTSSTPTSPRSARPSRGTTWTIA